MKHLSWLNTFVFSFDRKIPFCRSFVWEVPAEISQSKTHQDQTDWAMCWYGLLDKDSFRETWPLERAGPLHPAHRHRWSKYAQLFVLADALFCWWLYLKVCLFSVLLLPFRSVQVSRSSCSICWYWAVWVTAMACCGEEMFLIWLQLRSWEHANPLKTNQKRYWFIFIFNCQKMLN